MVLGAHRGVSYQINDHPKVSLRDHGPGQLRDIDWAARRKAHVESGMIIRAGALPVIVVPIRACLDERGVAIRDT